MSNLLEKQKIRPQAKTEVSPTSTFPAYSFIPGSSRFLATFLRKKTMWNYQYIIWVGREG